MSKVAALLAKDARGIARDGLLAPLCLYPPLIAMVTRLAAGWIPIEHMEIYLAPAAVTVTPILVAMIFGFALVEEREQGTWLLLRVIPLSQGTLVGYLVATTSGFSFLIALLSAWIYGRPVVDWPSFLALMTVSTLAAPLLAFVVGAIATNKIEAFALGKILGNIPMLPALLFVIGPGWQRLLYWNPFYWIYVGMVRAYAGESLMGELAGHWPSFPAWMCVAVPLALFLGGIWYFGSLYRRRAG